MNKFKFLIVLFSLLFISSCSAQKRDKNSTEIVIDTFLDISFDRNQLILNKENKEILNKIGDWLIENDSSKYNYYFEIIPSTNEGDDEMIEFKRVRLLQNYFKRKYNVNKSKFKFIFHDAIPINSLIRFSVVEN